MTRASIVVLSLVAAACGENPSTSPTAIAAGTGSIGGFVTERTPSGDRPLASARVSAWIEQDHRETRATTNSQGRYQVSGLPPGSRVWLQVFQHYPASQCAQVVTATAVNVEFNLAVLNTFYAGVFASDPPGSRSISGTIYERTASGRTPISWARVDFLLTWTAGTLTGSNPVHWTETYDGGRFRLCGLPEGSGGIVLAYPDEEFRETRIPVPPGPSLELDIDIP